MKKIELLAPAGSWESLVAAIQSGADAVYLAGKNFGARKSAVNFTIDELNDAVKYCHVRGKKIYITVNTLVKEDEIENFVEFMDSIYPLGIDAFIVQDLGIVKLLKNRYKNIEIHGSTQMTLNNTSSIQEAEKLGIKRVVLPRELEIQDIEKINSSINIETEVFIHGALCISYSGQCLMSSLIGGRSGNRGACAQACRQEYELINKENDNMIEKGFLLSPKDIMTIEHIDKIIDSGVHSLKIEGRLKKPEYNSIIVNEYRKAIDDYYEGRKGEYDLESIEQVFNRDFSNGYILGDSGEMIINKLSPTNKGVYIGNIVEWDKKRKTIKIKLEKQLNKGDELQIRRGNKTVGTRADVILKGGSRVKVASSGDTVIIEDYNYDAYRDEKVFRLVDTNLMSRARDVYNGESPMVPLSMKLTLKLDSFPLLEVEDKDGNHGVFKGSVVCEKAINRPLDDEKVSSQISKLGNTPYYLSKLELDIEKGLSLPIKELNNLRRQAVDYISECRSSIEGEWEIIDYNYKEYEEYDKGDKFDFRYVVSSENQIEALLDNDIEEIFVRDIDLYKSISNKYPGINIYPVLPRIIDDKDLNEIMDLINSLKPKKVISGSLALVDTLMENGVKLIGDFSLNVFNHITCEVLEEKGFEGIVYSPELNKKEVEDLAKKHSVSGEIIAYGYVPVMTSKYCPKSTAGCCSNCQDSYVIKDKTGAEFPIIKGYKCRCEILNSKKVFLLDQIVDIKNIGVEVVRLDFYDEDYAFVDEMVKSVRNMTFSNIKESIRDKITRGHFSRGVI